MITSEDIFGSCFLCLSTVDIIIILCVGIGVFIITWILYRPLIKWLRKLGYVGKDIHKTEKPEIPESGGLGILFGIIIGLVVIVVLYPRFWNDILIFIITIILAALIGWYDDRKRIAAWKKILLTFITGLPIFFANIFHFITVKNPVIPFLGQLRLTIIYPLLIPFIIMIMTNTVNMLEGYNGEGSGSCLIALIFLIISALLIQSTRGFIFTSVITGPILAFWIYNRYPAKVFPGDIGTLVIGVAIAMVGIFGSLEVMMVIVMLPQIFNSFYVITSERGFKESHSINKKDIWVDDQNYINASIESDAPLTLPRLILMFGKLPERHLVRHFYALSFISGLLSIIAAQWLIPLHLQEITISRYIILGCVILIVITQLFFKRIFGLVVIMIILLGSIFALAYFIDRYILSNPINWLWSGLLGLIMLAGWYLITIVYFKYRIKKLPVKQENEVQSS